MYEERERYPAFQIPIVVVPTSIDNNLPGTELSVGADSALDVNVSAIDKIKMSGSATTRAFVVETMGRFCGFQALMSGLAGGAERVYLNEEGIELNSLAADVNWLQQSFAAGRRFFLAVRNEQASDSYTTEFIGRLWTVRAGAPMTSAPTSSGMCSKAPSRPRRTGYWPPGWSAAAFTRSPMR